MGSRDKHCHCILLLAKQQARARAKPKARGFARPAAHDLGRGAQGGRSGRSIAPIKSCDIEWNGILSISFALGVDDVDSMCRGISDIAKDNRATRVLHDEKWQLKVEDRDKKRTLCAF